MNIFAEKDGWITPEVVDNFKETAEGVGKKVSIYQFDADPTFANPSSKCYDKEAATKANKLALDFLKKHL
ncbi:MAG: dienelactone hydrolase family protein [Chitinophagales bacterium]